jgi:hypothetical protein
LRNDYLEAAELFLSRFDFSIHQQSLLQGTPLTAAAFNHHTQLALKLLYREDRFDCKLHPRAFLCAVENDDEELITAMINYGADVNFFGKDNYIKPKPWVWEERLPSPFVEVTSDPIFELPIILALRENKLQALSILLKSSADLDKPGEEGLTANQLLSTNRVSAEAKKLVTEFLCQEKSTTAQPTI